MDGVRALRRGRARTRADLRDVFARHQIVRRHVAPKGKRADPGPHAQGRQGQRRGLERGSRPHLPHERRARQAAQREHGALARGADVEARRRRVARLDLIADLLQRRGDGLGREEARRHDVRVSMLPGALLHHSVIVVAMVAGAELSRLHRFALGVAHAIGHDQRIARVLLEQLVGFGVHSVRLRIPHDLVDADFVAERAAAERAAEADQEHAVAVDARDVDRTAEGDRQARLDVESVQRIQHVDVLAANDVERAIGLGEVHAPPGVLRAIGHREAIAWKDGQHFDARGESGERAKARCGQQDRGNALRADGHGDSLCRKTLRLGSSDATPAPERCQRQGFSAR